MVRTLDSAVGPLGLEAAEVVPADERLGRPRHRRRVERLPARGSSSAAGTGRHRAVVDHVAVQLAHGVAVGVERLRHVLGRRATTTSSRQMGVDRPQQTFGGELRVGVEVDDLADGVDAGIGSAAGVDADALLAGELGDGLFERLLHGAVAGLRLPAVEVGAVVAEGELEVAGTSSAKSIAAFRHIQIRT